MTAEPPLGAVFESGAHNEYDGTSRPCEIYLLDNSHNQWALLVVFVDRAIVHQLVASSGFLQHKHTKLTRADQLAEMGFVSRALVGSASLFSPKAFHDFFATHELVGATPTDYSQHALVQSVCGRFELPSSYLEWQYGLPDLSKMFVPPVENYYTKGWFFGKALRN